MTADGPEARIRALAQRRGEQIAGARERLLAEALVLFYARGIRAVGVDLVIAEAGVAKASFYRHFHSKLELVLAYIDRRQEAWLTWLREDVERRADGQARLLAIFDALAELFTDPEYRGSCVVNAVVEMGPHAPEVLERGRHHKRQLTEFIAGLAVEAGVPRSSDIAHQWVVLIEGAMVGAQCVGDTGPAGQAHTAADSILQGNGRPRRGGTKAARRTQTPKSGT